MKSIIDRSQKDYLVLLRNYGSLFDGGNLKISQVAMFIDSIKIFWLKQMDILEYEFNNMTTNADCFVLSGAIYLNAKGEEKYYFKSLGDIHVILDPFLKMEPFFRKDETDVDLELFNYIKRVYDDVVYILQKYPHQFFILPIHDMAWRRKDKLYELLESFYWKFMSSILHQDIHNNEEFDSLYKTYDEIEKNLDSYFLANFILLDSGDGNLSLADRVNRFINNQPSFSIPTINLSEAQMFSTIVYSQVSQVIDILLTCASMKVVPYIRFDVTFRYFLLVMETFLQNEEAKTMIEKTIIFYVLHNVIDEEVFREIDFLEFCERTVETHLLARIYNRLKEGNIDIISDGVSKLSEIIEDEFSLFIRRQ